MSLARDFMQANQYNVDSIWLFMSIFLCTMILHFSITLQFSAYFHVYFNIVKKYEALLHSPTYIHLKNTHVLWDYFMGLFFCRKWRIFRKKKQDTKQADTDAQKDKLANDPLANLQKKRQAAKGK